MKKVKITAQVIVLTMVFLLFAACGTESKTSSASSTSGPVAESVNILEDDGNIETVNSDYTQGCAYLEAGEYMEAITYLGCVSVEDDCYIDAAKKLEEAYVLYADVIINRADEMISEGLYDAAFELLDNASYNVTDASVFDRSKTLAVTAKFEETLTKYLEANDIASAIGYYETAQSETYVEISANMTEQYSLKISNYRTQVLQDAEIAANSGDYQEALLMLEDALLVLTNDADLQNAKTDYEAKYEDHLVRTTPISLADIEPYENDGIFDMGVSEDVMGNEYSNCISAEGPKSSAAYRIDGIYTTFTGAFYIDSKKTGTARNVSISGDGVDLFSASINGAEDPTHFSIDVTGVRDLRITMESSVTMGSGTYLGDPILTP